MQRSLEEQIQATIEEFCRSYSGIINGYTLEKIEDTNELELVLTIPDTVQRKAIKKIFGSSNAATHENKVFFNIEIDLDALNILRQRFGEYMPQNPQPTTPSVSVVPHGVFSSHQTTTESALSASLQSRTYNPYRFYEEINIDHLDLYEASTRISANSFNREDAIINGISKPNTENLLISNDNTYIIRYSEGQQCLVVSFKKDAYFHHLILLTGEDRPPFFTVTRTSPFSLIDAVAKFTIHNYFQDAKLRERSVSDHISEGTIERSYASYRIKP